MSINFKIILLLICSQVFLFLIHTVALRILIKKKVNFLPLLVAMKCAFFGNIPLLLITGFLFIEYEIINVVLYVLIAYNALAYSYCHIFNISETARRIRILYELNLAGRLQYNELAGRYGAKNMLDVRLERLMDMKQIAEYNGRFVLRSLLLYRIGVVVLKWGFLLRYNIHLKEVKMKSMP